MTVASPPRSAVSGEELARMVSLEEELDRTIPEVDRGTIRQCVGRAWASFRDARVRDYIPVLVRRQVLAELRRRRAVS